MTNVMTSDPRGIGAGGGPARGPSTPAQILDPSQFSAMSMLTSQSPSLSLPSLQSLQANMLGQRRLPDMSALAGISSSNFYEPSQPFIG